jgi:hypothetical protein
MTTTAPPVFGSCTPVWSQRPYSDADSDAVLALFTEPEFYFRTAQPDTRPEWEIRALLDDDTHVLEVNGRPIGLYAIETVGGEHGSHYQLHLRLSATAPLAWWISAYEEVVRAFRFRHEVVRLAWQIGTYDRRGREVAGALRLTDEGTLTDVVIHNGQRHGYTFHSQIWAPTS